MFEFSDLVQSVAAYHCLAVAVLLVYCRRLPILAVLLAVFAVHLLLNVFLHDRASGLTARLGAGFSLAYGPLFYLVISRLAFFNPSPRHAVTVLHFVPALAVAVLGVSSRWGLLLALASILGYFGAAVRLQLRHKRATAETRSDDAQVSLRWVGLSVSGFAVIAVIDICREIWLAEYSPLLYQAGFLFTILSVTGLLSVVALLAWAHDRQGGQAKPVDLVGSDIESSTAMDFFRVIDAYIREHELWRSPALSLADVATRTGYSGREVSRAINTGAGTNFSDYINAFRVQAFSDMVASETSQDRSLLEMALAVGFNSKSAFNRVYRQHCGMTPSQARKARRTD